MGLGGSIGFLPSDISNMKIWVHPESGITKDGGDLVSTWTDASGQGNDLVQATGTNQPLWVDGLKNGYAGIRFDGVDNFMKAVAFAWEQPETIYIVFSQITWTSGDYLFDGEANNSGILAQAWSGVSPDVAIYGGVITPSSTAFTLNSFHIGTVIINGAASVLQHNDTSEWAGDAGNTADMGGFTLGSQGSGLGAWSRIDVLEIAGYSTSHTTDERTSMKNYFSDKYAITL